jgi:hypothetical protein
VCACACVQACAPLNEREQLVPELGRRRLVAQPAVPCNSLRYLATARGTLQQPSLKCNSPRYVATARGTMQQPAVPCSTVGGCNMPVCVATSCAALPRAGMRRNVPHAVATPCATPWAVAAAGLCCSPSLGVVCNVLRRTRRGGLSRSAAAGFAVAHPASSGQASRRKSCV